MGYVRIDGIITYQITAKKRLFSFFMKHDTKLGAESKKIVTLTTADWKAGYDAGLAGARCVAPAGLDALSWCSGYRGKGQSDAITALGLWSMILLAAEGGWGSNLLSRDSS